MPRSSSSKILSRDQIADICRSLKAQGKTIGFTSGAFDILHAGHVDYIERARALCDCLVVAVNTDDSVRQYKGPARPIMPQDHRAALIAALECVDYVFLFSERRNARNIEIIQPDFYIKAGDYSPDQLTSASVAEQHGGKIILLPIQHPVSTSAIIQKIQSELNLPDLSPPAHSSPNPSQSQNPTDQSDQSDPTDSFPPSSPNAISLPIPSPKVAPAVFIDRDGTINPDIEYLHEPERFELLPNAAEGMKKFADMGYRIVIVTNQAGIGLGYYTKEDFYKVNRAMFRALAPHKVAIDRIYFCPHAKTDNCACRKPEIALFQRAQKDLNLDLSRSIMIGDRTADLECARRLGMTAILVQTGQAGLDQEYDVKPEYIANDILDAAEWVLGRERG